jgi:hypothetical protein
MYLMPPTLRLRIASWDAWAAVMDGDESSGGSRNLTHSVACLAQQLDMFTSSHATVGTVSSCLALGSDGSAVV